jgi:hypothetical protein
MSAMAGYGTENDMNLGSLDWKVGRQVTVFTRSGGRSGQGFTGILVESTADYVKLINNLSYPPRSPFSNACGRCGGNSYGGYGRYCNRGNPFGTVILIPRSEIVAYVFNEI